MNPKRKGKAVVKKKIIKKKTVAKKNIKKKAARLGSTSVAPSPPSVQDAAAATTTAAATSAPASRKRSILSVQEEDTNAVLVAETLQKLKQKLDAERDQQRITSLLHERLKLQKLVAAGDLTTEQADAIISTKVVESKATAGAEEEKLEEETFNPYKVESTAACQVGQHPTGAPLVEGKVRLVLISLLLFLLGFLTCYLIKLFVIVLLFLLGFLTTMSW